MKKNLLFAAIALTALAGCTSDEFVGDQSPTPTGGNADGAISFNMGTAAVTRAIGESAATALSNYFIVYGEKNETDGNKAIAAGAENTVRSGHLVFPNYTVHYVNNSALSTTSNTKSWEYVNIAPISTTNVTMYDGSASTNATSPQTIKYWDYAANSYTFTAVSALSTDISSGNVLIQKNTQSSTNLYQKGYIVTLKSGADASKLFFADRKVINKTENTDRNTAGYGGYVEMQFRNLLSQIRVGMYETIPGYKVDVDRFYYDSSADPATFDNMTNPATADNNFYANLVHQAATGFSSDITLTVTYKDNTSSAVDQPTVAVSGGNATNYLTLGTNIATVTYIGEDATAVTFDQSTADTYTTVFPQEGNTTHDLKMKVDYTLYNEVTRETIKITGATAVIPAEYLQWKANYKYSYIFKLTDDKLHPITFDAVTVDASDGSEVQYITTISEPSITTYAKASAVTTNNEYKKGSNIYVVVNDGVELTPATNAKLYVATIEAGAAQGITEETVKNAIATNSDGYGIGATLENGTSLSGYYTFNGTSYVAAEGTATGDATIYYQPATYSVKDANGKKLVVNNAAESLTAFTGIPATDTPDGIAIADIKGAKFTPASAGYYVFEYTDGSSNKHYKVIKVVD